MLRTEIINTLINKYNYKNYLEIGVFNQEHNFNHIKCENKIGVDPNGCSTYALTSDDFFSRNTDKFDIVFIDGLHTESQVDKDISNSLKFLNSNGTIVLHDCLPYSEWHQRDEYGGTGNWAGTVWKSVAKLRTTRKDLSIEVVDTDYGCGIIRFGKQTLHKTNDNYLNYSYYEKYKQSLMNIITVEEFRGKYV